MSYTALYRKFRPDSFQEVKGQEPIVTTLKNQILSGRIGHAYLFCGTRGTGKTSIAKLFAKAVNCEHPNGADPCNACESCVAASRQAASNIIEIDAASNNSVDDVRNIRAEVEYRPAQGKYKVYIIDEAHMLSTGAFNALLKTLEEPPEYVIFILATTEAAKLPVTIVSRCQRFDFKRISADTIYERMADLMDRERIRIEEKGLRYISRLADGSMRDALSLLERVISGMEGEEITYDDVLSALGTVDSKGYTDLTDAIRANDIYGAIRLVEHFSEEGRDMGSFASGYTWYLRNLLLARNADDIEDLLDVTKEEFLNIRAQAALMDDEDLIRYICIFSELTNALRTSISKRIDVEMAIIRLCRPAMETGQEAYAARIRDLENKVEKLEKTGIVIKTDSAPAVNKETAPDNKPAPQIIRKAAPEGLMRIKDKWESIVSSMPGSTKAMLEGSETQYNSKDPGNTLYIKVNGGWIKDFFDKHKDSEQELRSAIEAQADGSVEIRFISEDDENRNPDVIKIQALETIQNKINQKIEIEE